ncbi:hypothetical protein LCI18_014727 [Fusarium solani-melongenae]|uniref:Uncharacterized protein n=1 Tax=Fusarium solani subsp. cucurbitae TaxID=2747967 RepID=A0ACD3ZRP1_FUSSC|nr:hypothetical protein LCI18_014727 [Fusarium solani-melongenae]
MTSPRHTPPMAEQEKRVSRACVTCRSRKTRCDLEASGTPGEPPCRRCIEKNQECVLATSRRGGRRIKGLRGTAEHHQRSSSRTAMNGMDPSQAFGTDKSNDTEENTDWLSAQIGSELGQPSEDEESRHHTVRLEGHFTSSDLLNPSDALDLLAHVADLEPGGSARAAEATGGDTMDMGSLSAAAQQASRYPPISSGALTVSDAGYLTEPYLVTAILTVATKDDPAWSRAHEACARHMESQISKLIYTGSTTVGAVEALLILAEWAPQPPEKNLTIGCGKEDQGSWMLVGVAIRLAYLQNLEQTGLVQRVEAASEHLSRQRMAWAACYMSDRQVSIRLGKGFWSRGPGPSTSLRATDFPSLQVQKLGNDNFALLFQAHLEITQLFSNAHDILYSSTSHREQLYVGGEYVRYIVCLINILPNTRKVIPRVKASLLLSYDFLRLYINAFAFQANLNRMVRRSKRKPAELNEPLFSELAGAPDARFIYESIDAANSLLSTLNGFIDPEEAFRYMPLKFYLYTIYAAVFLFNAILSGAIKASDARGVRRAIHETICRLQKTSSNRQGLGQRYARSLRLLWQKTLAKPSSRNRGAESPARSVEAAGSEVLRAEARPSEMQPGMDQMNSFSWKDLDSLGQFISGDGISLSNDGFITTPELDSVQGIEGPDNLGASFWYPSFSSGNNIIFRGILLNILKTKLLAS